MIIAIAVLSIGGLVALLVSELLEAEESAEDARLFVVLATLLFALAAALAALSMFGLV